MTGIDSDHLREFQLKRGDPIEYGLKTPIGTELHVGYYLSHDSYTVTIGDKCILRSGELGHALSTQTGKVEQTIRFDKIIYLNRLARELKFKYGGIIQSE